jgi:hypothetical protein
MFSIVIEANIKIVVVTGVHRDFFVHILEEVVSSCPTQHEAHIKHTRLEDQQPKILLEDYQINATLAAGIKVIMADVITLWTLHGIGLPWRGAGDSSYVPVRTICS